MNVYGAGSAPSRRTMMVAGLLAGFMLTAVSVQAQDAPAPAGDAADQAAQPAPQEDVFKFTTDAAVMSFYVKPEQTSSFENVWGQIRGRLAASDNTQLNAVGSSIKVYRVPEATEQGVIYFVVADPVVQGVSYSPSPFLLFEAGLFNDEEARPLFEQLNNSLNGIVPTGVSYAAAPVAPPPAPAAPAEGAPAEGAPAEGAPAPQAQ
jgi:hypothetical protein